SGGVRFATSVSKTTPGTTYFVEDFLMRFQIKRRILVPLLAATVVAGAMATLPATRVSAAAAGSASKISGSQQLALNNAMRGLWEEHVLWTRLFIVSDVANLPDLAATTARLQQNQTDIGNAVAGFYGDAAGNQLTGLLKEHILEAAAILNAAKAG